MKPSPHPPETTPRTDRRDAPAPSADLAALAAGARRGQLGQSLRSALESDRDQFQLALQPIVDAGSGAILSWEVLIRWCHPALGNVSPAEFIPIAEDGGLIEAVGDLVLEAAVRYLAEVPPSVELTGRDASLSVNISPLQLTRKDFGVHIGAMLDARGIDHQRLCLEVNEAVFADPEAAAAITGIRRLGVLVAVDAFGIGHASLATLQNLPADVVKLDRSFLPDLDADLVGGRTFLTAVVDLAHTAGLRVVVEGVENQVQLNAVVTAGADAIQGYLLGAPMPASAAMAAAQNTVEERPWRDKFEAAALFAAGAPLAAESPGILERLRMTTRSAHAAIDAVPCMRQLLAPTLTAAEYVDTLRRLHAFHASIEPSLARCLRGTSQGEALLDGAALTALAADLDWFGAAPVEPQSLQQSPTCAASALGALYVMESSKLGGRIVGRHLAKTLGVAAGAGGSFFCGLNPEDARRRWRLLQEVLHVEIDGPGVALEQVISSALATFEAFERFMRGTAPAPADAAQASAR